MYDITIRHTSKIQNLVVKDLSTINNRKFIDNITPDSLNLNICLLWVEVYRIRAKPSMVYKREKHGFDKVLQPIHLQVISYEQLKLV